MKFLKYLLIGLMVTAFACNKEEKKEEKNSAEQVVKAATEKSEENVALAKMEFAEKEFNFGDIQQGDKVEHIFKFKNAGEVPLKITNVKTTCGCTAPEWPETEILPGEESEIKVVFNSRGKKGKQEKMITVLANVQDGMDWMRIKANVLYEDKTASK